MKTDINYRPSTQKLEIKIKAHLKTAIADAATFTPTHPTTDQNLNGKGLVVMQEVNDLVASKRLLTPFAASPAFQFACYHKDIAKCRQLSERISREIEQMGSAELAMEGQVVQAIERDSPVPPRFRERVSLFVACEVYRFFLAI